METQKSEEELDLTQLEYAGLDQTAKALSASLEKRSEQIDQGFYNNLFQNLSVYSFHLSICRFVEYFSIQLTSNQAWKTVY